MVLGSIQPLTEMRTSNIFWGVKAAGALGRQPYYLHVPTVLKSGSLILLQFTSKFLKFYVRGRIRNRPEDESFVGCDAVYIGSYQCSTTVCFLRLDEKAAGCCETSVYSHLSACRHIPTALRKPSVSQCWPCCWNWRTLFLNCEQMHLRELLMSVDSSRILPHCLPEDMYPSVFRCDQSAIVFYLQACTLMSGALIRWRWSGSLAPRLRSWQVEETETTGDRDW